MKVPGVPLLVGWETEVATLQGLLAGCVAGHGSVAVIGGPVGCGKTALLHHVLEQAVDAGALTLTAIASRAESGLPAGVVGQLFRNEGIPPEFRRSANELLDRRLSGAIDATADSEAIRNSDAQIAHGLFTMLLEMSKSRPVVVAVDDLQHADTPSLRVLSYLQRRMASSRLFLVLTELSMGRLAHPDFHAELFRQPNCTKIRLGLLSRCATTSVIEARLGPIAAAELGGSFHAASGGSPLLLSAMMDDYQATTATHGTVRHDTEYASREALHLALTSCLHQSEACAHEVARALAVLGEAPSSAVLAHLIDADQEAAEHGLAWLTAAGLLGEGRFRHPAARTIILGAMAAAERRNLHLRAAAALHNDSCSSTAVAEHLIAAGHAPEEWMLGALRDAAEQEAAADRLDIAAQCLDLALAHCDDAEQRARLTAERAHIEWCVSPSGTMRYAGQLRSALRAGHLDGRGAVMLLRHLLWNGRNGEAREVLAEWWASAPRVDHVVAQELTILNWWYPTLIGSASFVVVPRAEPGAAHSVQLHGRWAADTLSGDPADPAGNEAVTHAEGVLDSNRLSLSTLELLHTALLTLLHMDRPDKAAMWSERLLKEAQDRSVPTWQALFASLRAEAAVRQGDFPTAISHGEDAMAQLCDKDWGVGIGDPLASLVLAASMMGRYRRATEYVRRPVPDAVYETRSGLRFLHARGHFHLTTGRHRAALADFEICGHLMAAWSLDLPGFIPWRSGAAEAHLLLGERKAAREVIEEQLGLPGGELPRIRGASLWLLAAATDPPDERLALLDEAARLLTLETSRFDLARCLVDLGCALEAVGDFEEARAVHARAQDTVPVWASHVVRVPSGPTAARLGTPAPLTGATALSEAEKRVAELAAAGHTNRAIARQLFITVSTVEQHLTKVYRKLSVRQRTDLGTHLRMDAMNSLCSS
ncbi:AAA family ATPase [Streptomyces sp. NPDC053427]|uniref:helix-turn-helix transcriptional regulator n=1 Tax=Streptomyces sp. NPDC053427 TaxID=3365701 RepID=UPI0037D55E31